MPYSCSSSANWGLLVSFFLSWLTWILGLPGWPVKFIVFAVVIGFIGYRVYGPGKQDDMHPAGPGMSQSQSTLAVDQTWQTAQGNVYISYFDRRLKGKNMHSFSKVVYRYTIDGERYARTHEADGWDAAETYREDARVEVHYLASDPSVSRLGEVIQ